MKKGPDLYNRAAHPYQKFPGVLPPPPWVFGQIAPARNIKTTVKLFFLLGGLQETGQTWG